MSWEMKGKEPESGIAFIIGHGFTRYVGFPITEEFVKAIEARNPKVFEILEMVIQDHEIIFDAGDLEGGSWLDSICGKYSRISIEEEEQLRIKLERILICESPLISSGDRETAQRGLAFLDAKEEAREQAKAKKRYSAQRRKVFNRDRSSLMLTVIKRDGYKCAQCDSTDDLTLDHIYPLSEGGTDALENLRILCRKHNSQKNNRIPEEMRESA